MSNPLSNLADTFLPPWVGKRPITSITARATVVLQQDDLALVDVNATWDADRWVPSSTPRRMYMANNIPEQAPDTNPPAYAYDETHVTAWLFSDGVAVVVVSGRTPPPHDDVVRQLVAYGTTERQANADRLRTGMTPAMVNAIEYGRTLEREGVFGTGD